VTGVAYLVGEITPLQAQISADVLVDGPCKLVVQLPCFKGKEDGRKCHQAGQGNEHGPDILPKLARDKAALAQLIGGIFDLVVLDRSVDENADVINDEADDLNRVLQAQGVPHQPQLVYVSKHEDGQIGGNGAGFTVNALGLPVDAVLKLAKDIAARSTLAWRDDASKWTRGNVRLQGKSDDGLGNGRQHEGPCPPAVRESTSWVCGERAEAAWWGSPDGRGILQAARRRGAVVETLGADRRWCCCRERSCDRGVDLPGGMRAPRGEKFWQYGSRDGRLACVDIRNCRRVGGFTRRTMCTSCQQCVMWATAGLDSS
jgi:hypothetical protein